MPGIRQISASGDQRIDGVLSSLAWAPLNLTYSFPTSGNYYGYGGEPKSGFQALNAAQDAAVNGILHLIETYCPFHFTRITETASTHATLRFGETNKTQTAHAYYPQATNFGGDSWYNHSDYNHPIKGTYAYFTFMHEIGHALGLKHGHEHDTYGALPAQLDQHQYSIMTYRGYHGATTAFITVTEGSYAQSLMTLDIAALQYMYGANYNHRAGDTVYRWSPTSGQEFVNGFGLSTPSINRILSTVWDGGGTDTYNLGNYTRNLKIDLEPGHASTFSSKQLAHLGDGHVALGNVFNALLFQNDPRSLIERAIGGSGNDSIIGNDANNLLDGRRGNDRLSGAAGDDVLIANAGTDRLTGGSGDDLFVIRNKGGHDIIQDFQTAGTIEKIDLTAFHFASFAALQTATTDNADGCVITLDGGAAPDSVTLTGVFSIMLAADDFIL